MWKVYWAYGFALLFLFSACSTSKLKLPSEHDRFSQIYLESGTDALYQEKFTEALAAFLEAIKYNPKSVEAWNNLGLAYYGLREPEKAKSAWDKALTINPQYTEAKTNIGALYLEENKLHESENQFKEVLRDLLYSKSYLAHYNLASIYLRENKPLLAEEHLNLAVKANKAYCVAWLQLGYLAENRNDYALAAERFRGATYGTCYNSAEAHYQLGQSFLKLGDQRAARSKFLELIQNFSTTDWARKAKNELSLLYSEQQ